MNKKFVGISALLIFGISTYFSFEFFNTSDFTLIGRKSSSSVAKKINPANLTEEDFVGPKTEECPLNGEKLTKKHKELWEQRRPLGVMIENHEDARNQSGLSSADVVFEFVAEGGITRFLTIFYCKDAKLVGPVRSARVYFISMLRGFGEYPLYAHVGGANTPGPADALGTINKIGWGTYNDMNQFSIGFPVYYRDTERLPGVATEHTMYSSTFKLWEYAGEKRKLTNEDEDGVSWDESFTQWKFQDGKSKGPVGKVAYDFWDNSTKYSVIWSYDPKTNSYSRAHGDGVPHLDKNTNKAISVKNVVVAFMEESSANDGYPGGHLVYGTTGKGEAIVFQNGEAIEATWSKKDDESQIIFTDSSGDEIEFVRGEIWISGVPEGNEVDY